MLKEDVLSKYIKSSQSRLKKVKHGELIAQVLKSQQQPLSPDTEATPSYKSLAEILSTPKLINSKAMKEYHLGRSFSENLEKKKHSNLVSFFAVISNQEKYRIISSKIGENIQVSFQNRSTRCKSIAVEQCIKTECKKKTKRSELCEKLKKIDQDVIKMIEPRSVKVCLSRDKFMKNKFSIRVRTRLDRLNPS